MLYLNLLISPPPLDPLLFSAAPPTKVTNTQINFSVTENKLFSNSKTVA